MTIDNTAYYGQTNPGTSQGEYNRMLFVIQQQIAKVTNAMPVRILEVKSGGLAPVGFVKIRVMVNQITGDDKSYPNAEIDNVPYLRLQGGSNAVIIDPKVGDIGLAGFCSRDISAVKNSRQEAMPGSRRAHDYSDAVYIGGMLNGTPTQYIQFTDGGIIVHSPTSVTVEAPSINAVATTSATVTAPSVSIGAGGQDLRAMVDERIIAVYNGHSHPANGQAPSQQISDVSSVSTSATKAN